MFLRLVVEPEPGLLRIEGGARISPAREEPAVEEALEPPLPLLPPPGLPGAVMPKIPWLLFLSGLLFWLDLLNVFFSFPCLGVCG